MLTLILNSPLVSQFMHIIRRAYHFCLTPLIMIAAVILFILDNLNVNVTAISSYMLKEAKGI
jgi:hypothetical protein